MSAALLKKSLEIVEQDLNPSTTTSKKKTCKRNLEDMQDNFSKKPSIQDIRKRKKEESKKAEENLAKLLKLSTTSVDKVTADKLIKRARTGRYVIPEQKPEKEEKSIFTEEDFKAFEREYFCS